MHGSRSQRRLAWGPAPVVMTQSTSRVWCSWLKKSGLEASSFLS